MLKRKKTEGIHIMNKLLAKMDKLLRSYFGLEKIEIIPRVLEEKCGKLLVLNTESFKRHVHMVPVDKMNLKSLDNVSKEKLGIAIGKMIANNLVVSFDEIVIKRDKVHAG